VTSTVFFAGAVFQATFRVLTRPRFRFLSEKKSLGPSIFSRDARFSARLDLTKRPDNKPSFETRSPERGVREDHPQQAHRVQRGVRIRRVSRSRLGGARAALDERRPDARRARTRVPLELGQLRGRVPVRRERAGTKHEFVFVIGNESRE
jgi:hypothetical protein